MNGKYIIRNRAENKWLSLGGFDLESLDAPKIQDIVHVDSFSEAILFERPEDAEIFLLEIGLKKSDHDLNSLKVFSKTEDWD